MSELQISRRKLLKASAAGAMAASTISAPSLLMAKEASSAAQDTSKIRDFDMIKAFYANYPKKLAAVRAKLGRPLTLTEKLLFVHLYHPESLTEFKRGQDYIELRPDRAGTHDIGGPPAPPPSAVRWPFCSSSPPAKNASLCPLLSLPTTS